MNSGPSGATLGECRLKAKRLLSQLEAEELFVLAEIAVGTSRKDIADRKNRTSDEVECTLKSLMAKIGAPTIADAVRTAILADL